VRISAGRATDTVNSDRNSEMQSGLLNAAKALDAGSPQQALSLLRKLPLSPGEEGARPVALALWKHLVLASDDEAPLPCTDRKVALAALSAIGAAATDEKFIWASYQALPVLEKQLGSANAGAVVAGVLWDRILSAHEGVFIAAFELFYRGGDMARCRDAWRQFLTGRRDFVPGYWNFQLYCKIRLNGDNSDRAAEVTRMLEATGRQDLMPLVAVYLMQTRQEHCTEICAAARSLADPDHRARVADYMIGMGFTPEDLPIAVAAFRELTKGIQHSDAALDFMTARLANAERRWDDVLLFAERAAASARHKGPAELLAANALGHLGQTEKARTKLMKVAQAPDRPYYLGPRAAFIRVTIERMAKGLPLPELTPLPVFEARPGRPLAQSLWVGTQLRWIERLAIKSYLANGWRFQLYAYDEIENVPEGCEVLDANAIIPRREVFKEGLGSGLHAGSVGAFSDLFRYRLLYERGGMWTDTDVINLKRFDPDGRRFISTEISDAGLTTLNGAIMAAPAGHAFVERAYERAIELVRADDVFYTRIGPHLLAELLVEAGVETMELMPPHFLTAVFWMNTGDLLDPYESFLQRLKEHEPFNLHAYTEMWRLLGLGLDKPPGRETFLGRLYSDHFGGDE
jgi:hypothetical protein